MRAILFQPGGLRVLTGADAEALARKGRPAGDAYVWLDVDAEDVVKLAEPFRLHHLAIEDCLNQEQRPKLDEYEDCSFLVVNVAREWSGRHIEIDELDLFLGEGFLITSHQVDLETVTRVMDQVSRASHQAPLGEILHKLLDVTVDSFFPALDEIGDNLEILEEEILGRQSRSAMEELFRLKRKLLRIRKVLLPQRDLLHSLTVRDLPTVDEKLKRYLIDVYDHAMRLSELAETYRELVSSALEAHLSATANRTNDIMKVMAAASAMFLPLNLIAGLYGMNFARVPL